MGFDFAAKEGRNAVASRIALSEGAGKLKPGLSGGFHDDRRPAAGRGDDAHVPPLGRLRLAEERGDFEEVLQGFHPHDPVLPEKGIIDRVGPGEGAGVRSGGLGTDLRTADFEDEDRFSPLQRLDGDIAEEFDVAERLEEDRDGVGMSCPGGDSGQIR